jgi:uncharacterized RDD family membrane protein YckC
MSRTLGDPRQATVVTMPDGRSGSAPEPRASLAARVLGGGGRSARAVAQATGIDDALDRATEEAIVRALESEGVRRAIDRVLESAVEENAVERLLDSKALERALGQALESELVDRLWERALASDEAQKLVERIAEAPEIRAAIAAQGMGIVQDLGLQIARVAGHLDRAAERLARLLLRRPPRDQPTNRVGLITRAVAFAIDGGLLNLAFVATAALLALLFGVGDGASSQAIAFGAGAWGLGLAAYLIFFWTVAGQTPGMRLLGICLDRTDGTGRRLDFGQAVQRVVAGVISIAALGLGFAAILVSERRRGWHDQLAGTDVVRDERLLVAPWANSEGRSADAPHGSASVRR